MRSHPTHCWQCKGRSLLVCLPKREIQPRRLVVFQRRKQTHRLVAETNIRWGLPWAQVWECPGRMDTCWSLAQSILKLQRTVPPARDNPQRHFDCLANVDKPVDFVQFLSPTLDRWHAIPIIANDKPSCGCKMVDSPSRPSPSPYHHHHHDISNPYTTRPVQYPHEYWPVASIFFHLGPCRGEPLHRRVVRRRQQIPRCHTPRTTCCVESW